LVDRQGKNLLGNFTPIADFQLKDCIEKQKLKNKEGIFYQFYARPAICLDL
jgi:hypothetical protein